MGPSAARHMRRARTSTLRNPNSTKGIPSVMPRDKGSTCAPGAERTSVLWRMSGCTIGSSAAWQERDGRGSAQTLGHVNPLVAVVSANRCDEMCRHAATRCWLAVCVHNTRATPPRLRACATITRTCPRSSARLGRSCSVGEADDETSRQRGVWDVPAKYVKVAFRRALPGANTATAAMRERSWSSRSVRGPRLPTMK